MIIAVHHVLALAANGWSTLPSQLVESHPKVAFLVYSTVTDFAKFLGLSTSVPRASAV
jgi:hypothetical protein